jgi:hypothetical protein
MGGGDERVVGDIYVRVVPPPQRAGELAGTLLEKFAARVDELGASIGEIAERLRGRLEAELAAEDEGPSWMLDEVELSFSLDLEAEAGVVVAKAKTTAGFEVVLTWKRS